MMHHPSYAALYNAFHGNRRELVRTALQQSALWRRQAREDAVVLGAAGERCATERRRDYQRKLAFYRYGDVA